MLVYFYDCKKLGSTFTVSHPKLMCYAFSFSVARVLIFLFIVSKKVHKTFSVIINYFLNRFNSNVTSLKQATFSAKHNLFEHQVWSFPQKSAFSAFASQSAVK